MSINGRIGQLLLVWIKSLRNFFLKPASAYPLSALRIGLSIVLLAQAFTLVQSRYDFYASDGIMQRSIAYDLGLALIPDIDWILNKLGLGHFSSQTAVDAFIFSYLACLIFLGLGLFTKVASVTTWFLHWALNNTSLHTRYGIDIYAHIFLFYLMFAPCGKNWSIDAWLSKVRHEPGSKERLILRIMQLHLCVSYLASGILKAQGEQWWNGELIWRALTMPIYQQWNMEWIGQWPPVLMFAGWMTLVLEIGYSVFIWPRVTRWLWITAMLALHVGIAAVLGLHLFGMIMCVLSFSLFAFSPEPGEFWVYSGITDKFSSPSFIVFDGDCTLCNRWVRFVHSRDPGGRFSFAPLNSAAAQKILPQSKNNRPIDPSSIYLVQGSKIYDRSSAVLHICRSLQGPWPILFFLIVIPRRLRDMAYKLVARYRYRLFGSSVCVRGG